MRNLVGSALLSLIMGLVVGSASAEQIYSASDLAAALSKQQNISEAQANAEIERVFTAIRGELKAGRPIMVKNFGRFYTTESLVRSRKGKNPAELAKNAAAVPVKSEAKRRYARFSAAEMLKLELNSSGKIS